MRQPWTRRRSDGDIAQQREDVPAFEAAVGGSGAGGGVVAGGGGRGRRGQRAGREVGRSISAEGEPDSGSRVGAQAGREADSSGAGGDREAARCGSPRRDRGDARDGTVDGRPDLAQRDGTAATAAARAVIRYERSARGARPHRHEEARPDRPPRQTGPTPPHDEEHAGSGGSRPRGSRRLQPLAYVEVLADERARPPPASSAVPSPSSPARGSRSNASSPTDESQVDVGGGWWDPFGGCG